MQLTDTSRVIYALLLSLGLALLMGPLVIPGLRRLKFGQEVRTDGPQSHLVKQGTPTMGGVIFMLPATVATLILAPRGVQNWAPVLTALAVAFGHGVIGFADDYIKVALKRSLGLKAREKLLGQILLAAGLSYVATQVLHLGTVVRVPYFGMPLDLGWLYHAFIIFMSLAISNAVNLTDGVDGLLGGTAVMAFAFYGVVAAIVQEPGLAVFAMAIVGGSAGFLRFNSHPARVFMGDTGSLFLGGGLAALATLTKTELLLPVIGLVFVAETVSVVLQVASFRLTGRRIFKMSPLHHHFELSGWSEGKVVRNFYLAGLLATVAAWYGLRGLVW